MHQIAEPHRPAALAAYSSLGYGQPLTAGMTSALAPILPPERRNGEPESVMMVLDGRGRVQFCNAPDALATAHDRLIGSPIRQLLPRLPLRETTPGYNVAYVRCAFSGDQWQQHALTTAPGKSKPVAIQVRPIALERGHCFLTLIRFQETRAALPAPALQGLFQNDSRAVRLTTLAA